MRAVLIRLVAGRLLSGLLDLLSDPILHLALVGVGAWLLGLAADATRGD